MDKPERHISRQELDRQRVRALQVDPVNNLLTDIAHESEPSLKYGRIVIRENEWPYDCYSCGVPFYEGDAALYRDTGEGEFSKTDPVDDSAFCSVDCIWTYYWSSPVFDPSKFVKGKGDVENE